MIELNERAEGVLVPGERLDRERRLSGRGHQPVERQGHGRASLQAQVNQRSSGHDHRLEVTSDSAQRRRCVTIDGNHLEVRPQLGELEQAPQAGSSDARAGGEARERDGGPATEGFARIAAVEHRDHLELAVLRAGQLVGRVHRRVRFAREDGEARARDAAPRSGLAEHHAHGLGLARRRARAQRCGDPRGAPDPCRRPRGCKPEQGSLRFPDDALRRPPPRRFSQGLR